MADDARGDLPAAGRSWRRGWRALLIGAGAMTVITVGVFTLWYVDDSDLRAVDAEAVAMGVPLEWPPSDVVRENGRLAQWARAVAAARRIPLWQVPAKGPVRHLPQAGEPLPDDFRSHAAAVDAAAAAELDDALDDLGDQTLELHETMTVSAPRPDFGDARRVATVLRERVLADPPERLARDAERIVRVARCYPSDGFLGELVDAALAHIAVSAICYRLVDARTADAAIAATLRRMGADSWRRLERTFVTEYVLGRDLVSHPPSSVAVSDVVGGPLWLRPVLGRLVLRAGRAQLLRHHLETLAWVRRRGPVRGLCDLIQALEDRILHGDRWRPSLRVLAVIAPQDDLLFRNRLREQLYADLVAAEIDGAPWPVDIFARDGSSLKRIERDGHLVGAYSVGLDGVDDRGDPAKDLLFDLYAKAARPSSASATGSPSSESQAPQPKPAR